MMQEARKNIVVPKGKHSTTAAAEQAESSEQPGTIDEKHWRARDSTSWSVPGGDFFNRALLPNDFIMRIV